MASDASTKPADKATSASDNKPEDKQAQKSTAALEEDDEFEDFPVEGTLLRA
jgi:26 proteasome complex subunit DSS1